MSEFVSENQAFLLTAAGVFFSALGACGMCILKSRCTTIKCCGLEITRDVIPATQLGDLRNPENNNLRPEV